jgi:hypothetical protein
VVERNQKEQMKSKRPLVARAPAVAVQRLVRCHGHRSTNLVFHFLEICSKRLYGIWFRRLFNNALNSRVSLKSTSCAYVLVFIVLPYLQQPLEAGIANKWLNGENGRPQISNGTGMNRSGMAVGAITRIQLGVSLADDGDKSIPAISPTIPPRYCQTNNPGDKTAKDRVQSWADSASAQFVLFMFGVLLSVGGFVFWDEIGRHWWRALMTPNGQSSGTDAERDVERKNDNE